MQWMTYSDSSRLSDHFSYIIYFNPSYGLKDMIFSKFYLFFEISGLLILFRNSYINAMGTRRDVYPEFCPEAGAGRASQ